LLLFVLGLDVAVLGSWLAILLAQEEEKAIRSVQPRTYYYYNNRCYYEIFVSS
jgi:hypothetical protein